MNANLENEGKIKIGQLCKKQPFTYGYRKITHLINLETEKTVNHKRVQQKLS
ncbi:transposase [Facklamia sp. P12955]|uniref:transposase n=1 Tax=Facklamia sp. P12955 TaxID=3421946 RepID=UPI003D164230